jgi:hypothetical protein
MEREMKVPEEMARNFHAAHWEFQRYDQSFHEAVFKPQDPDSIDVNELAPLLQASYEYVSGRK